jgi:hypothetical protein
MRVCVGCAEEGGGLGVVASEEVEERIWFWHGGRVGCGVVCWGATTMGEVRDDLSVCRLRKSWETGQ